MTETINEAYIGWLHEKCYSGTSPKQVLTGPNILPALERCLPWRSFAWLRQIYKTLLTMLNNQRTIFKDNFA